MAEHTQVMDPDAVSQVLAKAGDETQTLPRVVADGGDTLALLGPLPRLSLTDSEGSPAELRFEGTLGSGGMADVHLAVQPALDRTVAVKSLKEKTRSNEAAAALVREGRITGSLEHPNIVPIHTMGKDGEGRPLLVMKRIEGEVWHDLLARPDAAMPAWVPEDRLQWHVEVLMQVCRAVSFAHNHNIIHRDLKPSNIMLGSFGEVYLLDWGIAVDLKEVSQGEDEVKRIVGSPAYMAPEMLSGLRSDVSPLTDVYLLGATLHRVITGVPRHSGDTPRDLWRSIKSSRPYIYDESIPEELAEICNIATRQDPTRRFQSAEEMRRRLADFLKHRASVDLSVESERRLRLLKVSIAAQAASGEEPVEAEVLRALGVCRFGFMQALNLWEGNSAARRGLHETLTLAVENELRRGEVGAAERLLAEMEDPEPSLALKVRRLVDARSKARARFEDLKAMEKDLDVEVSSQTRSLFTAGVGLVSFVGPLAIALAQNMGVLPVSHTVSLITSTLMLVVVGLLTWFFRKWIFRNKVNQRLTYTAIIAVVAFWLHRWRAMILGLTAHQAIAGDTFLFAIVAALASVTLDARIVWAVPVYLTASFSAAWQPSISQELSALANLLGIGLIALSWWRVPHEKAKKAKKAKKAEDER